MSLPDAIRAAVESQGVPWGARTRIATPEELADELRQALGHTPDMACDRGFVAALIGECAQESDWFCATAEYGGPSTRCAPWYGRGLIQLTWQANYADCTEWFRGLGVDADLIADPDRAQTPVIRWLTAVYYFVRHIPAHYWRDKDWDSISGLVNGGSAAFRGPSFPARAAACSAAYDHITDDDLGDDMPSADEIARAILDTQVTRQGLPDTDARAGQPVTIRAILEWLDAAHASLPGDTVQRLMDTEVPRHGLPDSDPRAGRPVSLREILAWTDARALAVTDSQAKTPVVDDQDQSAAPPPDHIHIVQAGETGRQIAQAAGISWDQLRALNCGMDWRHLTAGTSITIREA